MPWPPTSSSGPPPPRRLSSPGPPLIRFALLLPISLSRKAEPSRSSRRKRRSWPSPRALCVASETQTPLPLPPATRSQRRRCRRSPAAVHAVVAVVAVDEVEVSGAAVEVVDAEVARHLVVVTGAAHHLVVAEVADDLIGPGTTVDLSLPRPPWIRSSPGRRRSGRCRGCRGSRRPPRPPRSRRDRASRAGRRPLGADDLRPPPVAARRLGPRWSRRPALATAQPNGNRARPEDEPRSMQRRQAFHIPCSNSEE